MGPSLQKRYDDSVLVQLKLCLPEISTANSGVYFMAFTMGFVIDNRDWICEERVLLIADRKNYRAMTALQFNRALKPDYLAIARDPVSSTR